jgi:vacuolar-type H+-ATPase subunit E/Vma4
MPLAALIATLEGDVDGEVGAMLEAARAEAATIAAASARACDDHLAAATRAFTAEQQAAADARIAVVERRARRDVLAARDDMLARIRETVRAMLPTILDDVLRTKLRAAAGDGARGVPTGYVAELAGGTLVEATLEAVLDRAWPHLAPEALALVEAVP